MLQSLAHLPHLHPLLPQWALLQMVKGKYMGQVLPGYFLRIMF